MNGFDFPREADRDLSTGGARRKLNASWSRTGGMASFVLSVLSIVLYLFLLMLTAGSRFDPSAYLFFFVSALPPIFAYSIVTMDTDPVLRKGLFFYAGNLWYGLLLLAGLGGITMLLRILVGPVALFVLIVILPLAVWSWYGMLVLYVARMEKKEVV